jgi:hypothetical protein
MCCGPKGLNVNVVRSGVDDVDGDNRGLTFHIKL